MRRWIQIVLFSSISLLFVHCEEEIDVELENGKQDIVVEGYIEANQPPVVFLTRSVPYFAATDVHQSDSLFVKGATVEVTHDGNTVTLREIDTSGIHLYTTLALRGEFGERYELKVKKDGKVLTASTTIPPPVPLDSVWSVSHNDSLAAVKGMLDDPDTLGNFQRHFTARNPQNPNFRNQNCVPNYFRTDFQPGYLYEDQYYNGEKFQLPLDRGSKIDASVDGETYGYFWKGDTVVVKWCSLDKDHYDFWETWEYTILSFDNPFSSPTRIDSNIEGGLGIWGGYGCTCHTLVIPEE